MPRLLIAMGIAMAALEAINAPMLGSFGVIAAVFAAIFAGLTWWFARRGAMLPAVLLGLLFLMELAFLPGYERDTLLLWIMQGATAVFSGLGLIAASARSCPWSGLVAANPSTLRPPEPRPGSRCPDSRSPRRPPADPGLTGPTRSSRHARAAPPCPSPGTLVIVAGRPTVTPGRGVDEAVVDGKGDVTGPRQLGAGSAMSAREPVHIPPPWTSDHGRPRARTGGGRAVDVEQQRLVGHDAEDGTDLFVDAWMGQGLPCRSCRWPHHRALPTGSVLGTSGTVVDLTRCRTWPGRAQDPAAPKRRGPVAGRAAHQPDRQVGSSTIAVERRRIVPSPQAPRRSDSSVTCLPPGPRGSREGGQGSGASRPRPRLRSERRRRQAGAWVRACR